MKYSLSRSPTGELKRPGGNIYIDGQDGQNKNPYHVGRGCYAPPSGREEYFTWMDRIFRITAE
jgi:hypothetical protein